METEIHTAIEPLSPRQIIRCMPESEWILEHGSGTLRKNKRLGMAWRSQYLQERVAWEFGHCFELVPRSRLTFGDAITEGDCHSVTEAGWYIDRYFTLNTSLFPQDYYECKSVVVTPSEGPVREGIGIVVRRTCASWLPSGYVLFAIVAQYNRLLKRYEEAKNPL